MSEIITKTTPPRPTYPPNAHNAREAQPVDIHPTDEPAGSAIPSPACTAAFLRMLSTTLPPGDDAEPPEVRADRLEAAQQTYLAFKPRDAAEAQLAALAVAAAQAATDGYARAA